LLDSKQATQGLLSSHARPQRRTERHPLPSGHLDAAERLLRRAGVRTATSLTEVGRRRRRLPWHSRVLSSAARPSLYRPSRARLHRGADAVRAGRARRWPAARARCHLAGAVSDYFDFLAARPNFIRLIEREALSGTAELEGVGTSRRARRRSRDQRPQLGSRQRVRGRGPAPPQHHLALLVPSHPCAHGSSRRRRRAARLEELERRKRHRRRPGAARAPRAHRPASATSTLSETESMTDSSLRRQAESALARHGQERARSRRRPAKRTGRPSFVRELVRSSFRLDLVHPYPRWIQPTWSGRVRHERLERFLAERVDSDRIDPRRQDPADVIQGLRGLGASASRSRREYGGLGLTQTGYTHAIDGDERGRELDGASLRGAVDRRPQPLSCSARRSRNGGSPTPAKGASAPSPDRANVGSDPPR